MVFLVAIVVVVTLSCVILFRRPMLTEYHRWRMEAAYESLYNNPEREGNERSLGCLITREKAVARSSYESHRQALVELGFYAHLIQPLPHLTSGGRNLHLERRQSFDDRLREEFPNHRHYWLAWDGVFETWFPASEKVAWLRFLETESIAHRLLRPIDEQE